MSILCALSSLALKGVAQAAGIETAGIETIDPKPLFDLLHQRFSDHSKRLTRALERSSDRAWRAVEVALAGTSWWDRCKLVLASGEQAPFASRSRPSSRPIRSTTSTATGRTSAANASLSSRLLVRPVSFRAATSPPPNWPAALGT